MKRKLLAFVLTSVLVGTMLAGCSGNPPQSSSSSPTAAPTTASSESSSGSDTSAADGEDNIIRIGVVGSLTGGSAIYGQGAQNSVTMAAEEINASDSPIKVEIVNGGKVVDDAGDAKQAVNAYNSLEPEKPEAIVGAFFSSITIPMAELANEQGMLLLATGATNVKVTQIGPTIFRDNFIDPFQGEMAANFAKEIGATKAAIVYAKDDDYSNGLKDAFIESATKIGIEIVYTGECTTKDTDFTAQASKVVDSGADFLFYPAFLDTVPLIVQQVRDAGFDGPIMGGDGWDGADTSGLESYFENCYFTNHYSSEDTSPAVQAFVTKYTERYGADTLNACAALYYDAIYMLVEAAKRGGGTDTASLVKGMTGMSFSGVGTFTLDENRNAIKAVVINTYVDGKVKWLKTLEP